MYNLYNSCKKSFTNEYNGIITNESHVIANYDNEYIHKLRVCLRKIRAATLTFLPFLVDTQVITFRDSIKVFAKRLGRVRDLDVFIFYLIQYQQTLEKPNSIGFVTKIILKKREKMFKKLKKYLTSKEFINFKDNLYSIIISIQEDKFTEEHRLKDFRSNLKYVISEVAKYKADTTIKDSKERLHSLRIAIKHLRYNLEFLNTTPDTVVDLKKAQEQLGIINDCESIINRLKNLLEQKHLSQKQKSSIQGYLEYIKDEQVKQYELLELPWSAIALSLEEIKI